MGFYPKVGRVMLRLLQWEGKWFSGGQQELCSQDIDTFIGTEALESPLDCKEIEPVNPKGNQS